MVACKSWSGKLIGEGWLGVGRSCPRQVQGDVVSGLHCRIAVNLTLSLICSMLKGHMFRWQPLQRLRQLGHFHCSACNFVATANVQASKAEQRLPAVPGTVKEYQQHIMIQTAPLNSDAYAKECHSVHGCWWPSVVEKSAHRCGYLASFGPHRRIQREA